MRDCGGTMSRVPEMFVCSGVCCAGRGGCRRDECVCLVVVPGACFSVVSRLFSRH